jgi:hypothetical protein
MSSETPWLIDELENADMLIIDGLHAWQFALDEAVLDQADAAAEANQPFASEATLLTIDLVDPPPVAVQLQPDHGGTARRRR